MVQLGVIRGDSERSRRAVRNPILSPLVILEILEILAGFWEPCFGARREARSSR